MLLSSLLLIFSIPLAKPFSHHYTNQSLSRSFVTKSSLRAMNTNNIFLSVSEAIKHHDNDTIFIDGSWHLSARDGRKEYESGPRIKNARFFDIDDVATKGHRNNLPHQMPPKDLFAKVMDEFEITPKNEVILYGTEGCFSLARVFYTFRAMGHNKIQIMQGSLQDWIERGGPTESGLKESLRVENISLENAAKYNKAVDPMNVVGIDRILEIVEAGDDSQATIVDARSAQRFKGEAPEPRPGLRSGHMPSSKNVPFNDLLLNDNEFRSKEDLVRSFTKAGVDVGSDKDIICTCGSGVTACWLALALDAVGRDPSKTFIFDGSWIEWASDEDNPVVKE